mgnify:CR=1 FL=1
MPVSEKKLRSNPAWIKRHLTDPFVKKSVQEGYRARSVYKLMEIDDKDKIIKPGMSVVDLGAAPGSWTQIVKERLTDKDGKIDGKVIAMDILPMEPIEGRLPRAGSRRQANRSLGRGEGRRRSLRYGPELVRCCRGRRCPLPALE